MLRKVTFIIVLVSFCTCADGEMLYFNDGGEHILDEQLQRPDPYNIYIDSDQDRQPGTHVTTLHCLRTESMAATRIEIYVHNHGRATINGGGTEITTLHVKAYDDATIVIEHGNVGFLSCNGNSSVTINGGTISEAYPRDMSSISIYGQDFTLDGQPIGYGQVTFTQYHSIVKYYGQLGGTLKNGHQLDLFGSSAGPLSPISLLPCPIADLNGDCDVNFLDLAIFASHWLASVL